MAFVSRTVAGTLIKPSGAEWAGAEIVFTLLSTKTDGTRIVPRKVFSAHTGAQGQFSLSLLTRAGSYLNYSVTLPNGEDYSFSLPDGDGSVNLADLISVAAESDEIAIRKATEDTLGGVMVDGTTILIDEDGTISAVGAVESVNGQAGAVVLDADDISDTGTTKKFVSTAEKAAWNAKQAALVNQVNLKSINNVSLLGSGNLTIEGGSGTLSFLSGYADLPAAVEAIADARATLVIDVDDTLSENVTVPATLKLTQANGAQITITAAGAILFEGAGLVNPLSHAGLFKVTSVPTVRTIADFQVEYSGVPDVIGGEAHPFTTGQALLYRDVADNVAGLADGTLYYVININSTTFKLAASYADALAGIAVPLTGGVRANPTAKLVAVSFLFADPAAAPPEISSDIVDTGDNSLTDRLKILVQAFYNCKVKYFLHPRNIDTGVVFEDYHSFHFLSGEFTNDFNPNNPVNAGLRPFMMASHSTATAERGAIVYESSYDALAQIPPDTGTRSETGTIHTQDGKTNCHIIGIHFKHSEGGVFNSSTATCAITNSTYSSIRDCHFDGCRAYHAGIIQSGYTGTENDYEVHDNYIENNLCTGYATQNLFIIGGYRNHIKNNRLLLRGAVLNAYSSLIDLEPNVQYQIIHDCEISGNYIDARDIVDENSGVPINTLGILAQSIYTDGFWNIRIKDNTILSYDADSVFANFMSAGIEVRGGYNCEVANNHLIGNGMYLSGLRELDCHDNKSDGVSYITSCQGRAYDNIFHEDWRQSYSNQVAGRITEADEFKLTFESDGSTVDLINTTSADFSGNTYSYYKGMYVSWNENLHKITSTSSVITDYLYRHLTFDPPIPAVAIRTVAVAGFNSATNEITSNSHGFETGAIVGFYRVGSSVVPTNLPDYLYYYVIKVSANVFKLATTRDNALNNTAIDFDASAASGTFEFHPTMQLRFTEMEYENNHFNNGNKTGTGEFGYQLLADGKSQILSTFTDQKITEVGDAAHDIPQNAGILLYNTELTADRASNLPAASKIVGKTIIIKDAGAVGDYSIIATPNGTDTIEGASAYTISTPYAVAKLKAVRKRAGGFGWILL